MTSSSGYIAIALNMILGRAASSIAGETYMDALDFNLRFRDVHECDPFYWHPLHLPEECADMYEELIRGRLTGQFHSPVHVVKHRDEPYIQFMDLLDHPQPYPLQYPSIPASYPSVIEFKEPQRRLTPYEKMLESVRIDVRNQPSFPSIQNMPMFGPVALYHQPVSKKSAKMITNLSKTYGGANREIPTEYEMKENDDANKNQKKKDINKMGGMLGKALQQGFKLSEKNNFITLTKDD